ncbi:hypothetical protein AMTRI_Chr07g23610 [Amborella trichopoda]
MVAFFICRRKELRVVIMDPTGTGKAKMPLISVKKLVYKGLDIAMNKVFVKKKRGVLPPLTWGVRCQEQGLRFIGTIAAIFGWILKRQCRLHYNHGLWKAIGVPEFEFINFMP